MDPFYARFFPGEHSDAELGYHRELQARVIGAGAVLDFGCGANTDLARYRTADREVWGVDPHVHPQLAHAAWFRRLTPSGRVPFPDASFDVIASCWVLEHIKDPNRFLGEVWRLLRPGGFFVAVSINALHYVTFLSRLIGLCRTGSPSDWCANCTADPSTTPFPPTTASTVPPGCVRWPSAAAWR
jgi:SAM-dependent methyltransferase